MIRLDKYLSDMNIGTRSESTKLIKRGEVIVNGSVIKSTSFKVNEKSDIVSVSGKEVKYKKYFYIMLNKPQGYITATEDNYNKTVMDLIDNPLIKKRVAPSGRLDIDTEGFVFMTDDGQLNHFITGPKNHVKKKYLVHLRDKLSDDAIINLENGVILDDGYKTKVAEVYRIDDNKCYLIISEGKFHQVKRMFKAVNNEVIYLKRTQIGNLPLDDSLNLGEYREISQEEVNLLKETD